MKPGLQTSQKSLLGVFLLFCFHSFHVAHSLAPIDTTVSTESRAGRLAVFDDIWSTIRDRYYDASMTGVNWTELRERMRPLAADAETPAEFYRVLRNMLGQLRDVHTRVYAPHENSRPREYSLSAKRVGDFGVVRFDTFTPDMAASFYRALQRELKDVRGLVIDLRNNGGGDTEAMVDVVSAFLPEGKKLGRFTTRNLRSGPDIQARSNLYYVAERALKTDVDLVVLVSARTSSAAEIFAAALKEANRAVIIGTQTCGCTLAVFRRHVLPDGGVLEVSEMDYHTALNRRLEGAGVMPDEKVESQRKDLIENVDRALERGIRILKYRTDQRIHGRQHPPPSGRTE
jgi:C-terminal processing protease CtpA/Prc